MKSNNQLNANTILDVLSRHIGKSKGLCVRDLVHNVTGESSTAAQERLTRTIITSLRMDGHHICAHPSSGYFIAANEDELLETCKYLYDRGMTSLSLVSKMKKISIPDLHGQMKLLN